MVIIAVVGRQGSTLVLARLKLSVVRIMTINPIDTVVKPAINMPAESPILRGRIYCDA